MFLFDDLRGLKWIPRADVYRTPTGWLIKLDLAGVRPEEVSVVARNCEIVVTGVRRDELVERGYRHHTMEISYSRFEKTITLPCRADLASIRTEYRRGMLVIALEMTEDEESSTRAQGERSESRSESRGGGAPRNWEES